MKRPLRCRKCGCDDKHACIEFDAKGRGWPCYWASAEVCSACEGKERLPPMPAMFTDEDEQVPFVIAPQLAGYIARPRR